MLARKAIAAQAGATLIEVMMTVVLLGVLMALAVPMYGSWTENAKMRTVAEAISTGLLQARQEAVSRNSFTLLTLQADGTWFSCRTPNNTAACGDPGTTAINQHNNERATSGNITLTSGAGNFRFNSLGVLLTGDTLIALDNTKITGTEERKLSIVVRGGGAVKMCEPGISNTADSRYCKTN